MSQPKERAKRRGSAGSSSVLNEISNSPDSRGRVTSRFAHGAIQRIKAEHFLTYTSVELFPSNNLNLIVGPNGTGKSTLVCAICLGLAGKPSMLGRAGHVTDFIQHGHDRAMVEIELFNDEGENWIITREIHGNGSSAWTINRKAAAVKSVEELVSKLNIQLGNLCQFLPQDRVSDFVRMSPVELLESTQKAVGMVDMFDWHCRLKTLRSQTKELETSERVNSEILEKERERHNQLEEEVKNFQEREKHLESIKVLKTKRKWLEYEAVREAYVKQRQQREGMKEIIKTLSVNSEPLRRQAAAAVVAVTGIDNTMKTFTTKVRDLEEKINLKVNRIEGYSDKVATISQALKEKVQDETQRRNRVEQLQQQLQDLEQELNEIEDTDTEAMQMQLIEVCRDLENVNRALTSIQTDKDNARVSRLALERKLQAVEREIQRIADVGAKKLEILRQRNRDAYQAVMWLRENKERFSKTVHEPIMMTISVHEPRDAKFIEAHISPLDLIAFIFEDKDDLESFMKVVRDEKKLKVNTGLVPDRPAASFKPRRPIESLKQYGFYNYLQNLFSAPDGVLRYLCALSHIHDTPVGSMYTEDNIEKVLRETGFSKVYTPNRAYTCRKSRYNSSIQSTLSSNLKLPSILTISIDSKRLEELQSEKKTMIKEIESLKQQCCDFEAQERELNLKQEELRNKKKELSKNKGFAKALTARIRQKQEVLEKFKNSAVDINAEELKTAAAISRLNAERLGILKDVTTLTKQILAASCENSVLAFHHAKAVETKRKLEKEYEDSTTQLKRLKLEIVKQTEDMKKTKQEGHRLMARAKEASGLRDREDLSERQRREFSTLPSTIEEIDNEIDEQQVKADCMNVTDVNIIRDYQKRKETIGRVENVIQVDQGKLRTLQIEIDRIKELWLPPLENLLDSINKNFSQYFQDLGCAGEVSLKKGDNPDDFEKYGISIRVKFRAKAELHELTNFHQSGGERSVSTVLFLLSLLELTKVPFRCVDEINQGMDSGNERKVFDMIVKTACSRSSSQYFLLTPKLLPDLSYSRNMAILFIHNGPLIKDVQWKLKKFIKKERRMQMRA